MTKTSIKLQLVKLNPTSRAGLNQWRPAQRARLFPYTFNAKPTLGYVDLKELKNKEAICDLIWRNAGPGIWDLRGICPTRNKTGFSPRTIVRVELASSDSQNEYGYHVVQWTPMRLKRYRKIFGWGPDQPID